MLSLYVPVGRLNTGRPCRPYLRTCCAVLCCAVLCLIGAVRSRRLHFLLGSAPTAACWYRTNNFFALVEPTLHLMLPVQRSIRLHGDFRSQHAELLCRDCPSPCIHVRCRTLPQIETNILHKVTPEWQWPWQSVLVVESVFTL
jgi:hypothetical protein